VELFFGAGDTDGEMWGAAGLVRGGGGVKFFEEGVDLVEAEAGVF
jgi:hypothetical protein